MSKKILLYCLGFSVFCASASAAELAPTAMPDAAPSILPAAIPGAAVVGVPALISAVPGAPQAAQPAAPAPAQAISAIQQAVVPQLSSISKPDASAETASQAGENANNLLQGGPAQEGASLTAPEAAPNVLHMDANSWNRLSMPDGTEIGVSVFKVEVDYGVVAGIRTKAAAYVRRSIDGGRKLVSSTLPKFNGVDWSKDAWNGDAVVVKTGKGAVGDLAVKIQLLSTDGSTAQIGDVTISKIVSKGLLRRTSLETVAHYPAAQIRMLPRKPTHASGVIDALTGITSVTAEIPPAE